MITTRRTLGVVWLALGMMAGCAVADGKPVGDGADIPPGVEVSTALLGLPRSGKARLALVQAFPDQPPVTVEVRFKDAHGRILARRRAVVGPKEPLIEEIARRDIQARGAVQIQTQLLIGRPVDGARGRLQPTSAALQLTAGAAPLGSGITCPLNLTVEIIEDEEDDAGQAYTCPGVDPCGGGETHGPGSGQGVFPLCTSRSTFGTPGEDPEDG